MVMAFQQGTFVHSTGPKENRELEVFRGFVEASPLAVASESIRHRPEPEPDILCSVAGRDHYFELSEVLWESPEEPGRTVAKGHHESERAAHRKTELIRQGKTLAAAGVVTAGGFGYPPLLSLRQSLERKATKSYTLNGRPCSLLLFYSNQSPVEPYDYLFECQDVLTNLLSRAAFQTVWLYRHLFSNSIALEMGTLEFAALGLGPVPLKNFQGPSDLNAVIGKIVLKDGDLSMAFDATYSLRFYGALRDLKEVLGN
jgi:hypothetical protein